MLRSRTITRPQIAARSGFIDSKSSFASSCFGGGRAPLSIEKRFGSSLSSSSVGHKASLVWEIPRHVRPAQI